jgi:glycogen operon protein
MAWHGVEPNRPDWGDQSRSLAFSAEMPNEGLQVYLALNAYWEPLDFVLPPGRWRRWIDTALESPRDIVPWQEAAAVGGRYRAEARSVVVLFADGPA